MRVPQPDPAERPAPPHGQDQHQERRIVRKVMWRLLPFLGACYLVSFLDRVNVSFAALQMNRELSLSAADFGLGAGLFFLPYFLFEVPANRALARFGARRWIGRIMISWGIVSAAFAFVAPIASALGTAHQTVFYALRFLLGAAEAGFFPGIVYYLTLWFPAAYRARVMALFVMAVPAASILGAPLSGALLSIEAAGLAGWQWLFLIEALPAILLGFAALRLLADGPAGATGWLTPAERAWLSERLAGEARAHSGRTHARLTDILCDGRVWAFSAVYFVSTADIYAFTFFLPTVVKGFGVSDVQTGFLAALPSVCGVVGMVALGQSSDRTGWRRAHLCAAFLIIAAGFIAAGLLTQPVHVMVALCVAGFALLAILPLFWPLPSGYLPPSQLPAGLAFINAVGNLAGFAGPYAFGAIKTATGDLSAGFLGLGGCLVVTAFLSLALPTGPVPATAPVPATGRVRAADPPR